MSHCEFPRDVVQGGSQRADALTDDTTQFLRGIATGPDNSSSDDHLIAIVFDGDFVRVRVQVGGDFVFERLQVFLSPDDFELRSI